VKNKKVNSTIGATFGALGGGFGAFLGALYASTGNVIYLDWAIILLLTLCIVPLFVANRYIKMALEEPSNF